MGKPVNKTLRIAAMSAGEEIGHVSGPIVTFRGNGAPLRSLLVGIDPVQEGTGDPSPDNVRPISGWSAVNVWRTGKNLFDMTTWDWPYSRRFWGTNSESVVTALNQLPAGTYSLSAKIKIDALDSYVGSRTYGFLCTGVSVDGRISVAKQSVGDEISVSKTFTITENQVGNFIYCYLYAGTGTTTNDVSTISDIQLELGSTATAYEPYSGNQYTIQLGQTVYGGTLDVTNGVLTVDRANIPSYNGETLPGEWISDRDVYAPGTTPTIGAQVVYTLVTPITIPLTPQEISTLQGQNNLWADSGNVDVEYIATGGEGGKLALLLRNRKELLIALRKGLSPAEVGLLGSIPSFGGFVRPGISTNDEKEEDELL